MKKTLNVGAIQNELGSASPFFREAREQKEAQKERQSVRAYARTGERVNASTPVRTTERNPERAVKRYAYNFYEDQIAKIDWLSLKRKMAGDKNVTRSDIVREALDKYFKKLEAKGDFEGFEER